MISGVLFDMDGVLVDSESLISRAAILMFSEHGLDVNPEDFFPFVGTGENMYIGGVASKYGLNIDIVKAKARVYQIYEAIAKDNLNPLPGVNEFISRCKSHNLRLALATSADRFKMEINLREINLPAGLFYSIVTGEDVINKKPFPDIYIRAARNLGLNTSECLVVEDAVSGIRAAKSAGCRCLAVTTSFAASSLSEADWICTTLADAPDEAIQW